MVRSVGSALLFVIAALNAASTVAVPLSNFGSIPERGLRDQLSAESPVDQDALLKMELRLKQMRVGLEDQEKAWKPVLLSREEGHQDLSVRNQELHLDLERRAKSPNQPAKPKAPKPATTKGSNAATKASKPGATNNKPGATTPARKGTAKPGPTRGASSKRPMPANWYDKQYKNEENKLQDFTKKPTPTPSRKNPKGPTYDEQFKLEQQRIKDLEAESKWKPQQWEG